MRLDGTLSLAGPAKRDTNPALLTCCHYVNIFLPALEEGDSCLEEQGVFVADVAVTVGSLFIMLQQNRRLQKIAQEMRGGCGENVSLKAKLQVHCPTIKHRGRIRFSSSSGALFFFHTVHLPLPKMPWPPVLLKILRRAPFGDSFLSAA